MKKIIIIFGAAIVIAPLILYAVTKFSSAYRIGANSIAHDSSVLATLGEQRYRFLIGMSYRGSGGWACTSLLYYVGGTVDSGVVNVRLQRNAYGPWNVIEVSVGYYTPFEQQCKYTP